MKDLARQSAQSAAECDAYRAEWKALLAKGGPTGDEDRQRYVERIRRFPGIPSATQEAWRALVERDPKDEAIDVSWLVAMPDCHFAEWAAEVRRLGASPAVIGAKSVGRREFAGSVLGVVRDSLSRPVSRQVFAAALEMLTALDDKRWVRWDEPDRKTLARIGEYARQFNARADQRERELSDRVFQAPSFREIAESDRKGIAAQFGYSFTETEKNRLELLPLLSRAELLLP